MATIAAIIPKNPAILPAVWCILQIRSNFIALSANRSGIHVTKSSFVKVPFDLERWQQIAAEEYPNGLPKPHSDDPTQWLFKGHPKGSTDPLQVAVARLLGYRWPDQEPDNLDALADADGIVPIPSVRGESPAAERLREVLKAAFGSEWSASLEHKLLTEAGAKLGHDPRRLAPQQLLRAALQAVPPAPVHLAPLGRTQGRVLVPRELPQARPTSVLDNLTYSYVQDWINLQAADARSGKPGADLRLAAAQALQEKLKLILAGEPPYDIFVRWKPLSEQAIGWNPDLNDGVRMNIRPFVEAGILRKPPNIKWTKDRGNEPQRPKEEYPWFWPGGTFKGDRVNDVHLTNQEKMDARRNRS